jgi:hypothetical protein
MAKPDLNRLKEEIETRKREKNTTVAPSGEQYTGGSPRDAFLYGLMQSLNTGNLTRTTYNVKTLNERAEIINSSIKTGKVTPEMVQKVQELKNTGGALPVIQQPVQQRQPNQGGIVLSEQQVDMSPERDEQLFRDLEARRKAGASSTLTESIESFKKMPAIGAPMNNNSVGAPVLNETYLVENVKKVVNNYLAENLEPIFEEAIKSTIIEMYAVERIKEVLQENKEMVKSIVIETIKEIQAKAKAAKAQS